MTKIFPVGGMWESPEWEVRFDYDVRGETRGEPPCPHCHTENVTREEITRHDGSPRVIEIQFWTCPRVIVAWNEGGYCTTGVCFDCVIQQAEVINATRA